jgi:integrase
MGQLKEKQLPKLAKTIGRHADGDGLFLRVLKTERPLWTYRYRLNRRETEISLGPYPDVSLETARTRHMEERVKVRKGIDPRAEKRARKTAKLEQTTGMPTFGAMAEKHLETHEAGWKNPKHRQQWRNTLTTHCAPIWSTPVDQVTRADVLAVLEPIWRTTPETARRLRGRIETVLDAAYVRLSIEDKVVNPARWKGKLDKLLPKTSKLSRGHHVAMPYQSVPAFMAQLRARPSVAARALEYLILTAARSGETFGMKWGELDLDHVETVNGEKQTVAIPLWKISAGRMKTGKEHPVALSEPAVAILKRQLEARVGDHPFVFPGARPMRPLSGMALEMLLRRMNATIPVKVEATGEDKTAVVTVHGFRAAFRTWAQENTNAKEEVIELCLAHTIGDDTRNAYARGQLIKLRHELMTAWGRFVSPKRPKLTVATQRQSGTGPIFPPRRPAL